MNDNLSNLLSVVAVTEARWAVARLSEGSGFHCAANKQVDCFLVVEGPAYLTIGGSSGRGSTVELASGDIVLSMGGASVTIAESPKLESPAEPLPDLPERDRLPWLQIGKGESKLLLIVGRYEVEALRWGPIRRTVPDVVVARSGTGELPFWTGALAGVRPLQLALSGDGAGALSRRLAELTVVQVIRAHYASNAAGARQTGKADIDHRILEAMRAINAKPAVNWTVESLARTVGMSRSVFSEVFDASVGEAPIRYLTRVRMQIAAQMLRNQSAPIIEIAHQVGYSSDISLIRSFKKFFGVTPTEFRSHLSQGDDGGLEQFTFAHPAFVFDGPTRTPHD